MRNTGPCGQPRTVGETFRHCVFHARSLTPLQGLCFWISPKGRHEGEIGKLLGELTHRPESVDERFFTSILVVETGKTSICFWLEPSFQVKMIYGYLPLTCKFNASKSCVVGLRRSYLQSWNSVLVSSLAFSDPAAWA